MSFLTLLLSPFNLLFFIIVAGFAVGKIRIKGISLGIAGILFVAILVGSLMNLLIPEKNAEIILNAQSTMKVFSKLGTSLFVSVIGLQTGFSIKNNSKRSMIAFVIGALMSIAGVLVMLLISVLDNTISYASLLGILCGSLTSTPGLSSVCELIDIGSENAVLGYGCSYLFGVILTVFFTQLFSKRTIKNENRSISLQDGKNKTFPELILISVTALLGSLLGSVKTTFLNISVGMTASTLIMGLIIGYCANKKSAPKPISTQSLNSIRNLGLALFFTGTGFSTGIQAKTFDIKTVLYGALITLTAIFFGVLLCKFVERRYSLHKAFIVAGGMTSSPAYGAIATDATESSINCFSFSYFGALISLILTLPFVT